MLGGALWRRGGGHGHLGREDITGEHVAEMAPPIAQGGGASCGVRGQTRLDSGLQVQEGKVSISISF